MKQETNQENIIEAEAEKVEIVKNQPAIEKEKPSEFIEQEKILPTFDKVDDHKLELEKYQIDKKFEIQKEKLKTAESVIVGGENLASISMLAEKFSRSGDLVPEEYRGQPEKCFVAIYKGASLGLDAFTSLQRIAVIKGRATIWGDTALALIRNSGLMVKFKEELIEEGGQMMARCTVQRQNEDKHISEFSQADAIKAGLWGGNVWAKYPKRMLKYRARAYALRDIFADVLDGLYLKEEMEGGQDFNQKSKRSEPIDRTTVSEEEGQEINDLQGQLLSKD